MEEKNEDFDLQKIKDLIALMKTHNLLEIEVVHGDDKVLLKRASNQVSSIPKPMIEQPPVVKGSSDEDLVVINSPMKGTFYAAVGPESKPFVEVGSEVTPQTLVCIIEAMKVMNEINAETTGKIVKILAKNRQAVEEGQPLFKVKPMQ